MTFLADNDVDFLMKATSLPFKSLMSLMESDFDLIIGALSGEALQTSNISFQLFTKLSIFKEAKDFDCPLSEKAYVADCVSVHYPKVFKQSHYRIDRMGDTEADAQYYLVLTGMFPEFITSKANKNGAPKLQFYIDVVKSIFTKQNNTLANHVAQWVDILYNVKNYRWY